MPSSCQSCDRGEIIIITLSSNHRVEIHFALWRLHKNTIFKSHSKACIQYNQACKYVNGSLYI